MSPKAKPASVAEYIAGFPAGTRAVLKELRGIVREGAPTATERISYGIPLFEVDGKYLIYIAGWEKHTSLYPVTRAMTETLGSELGPYQKGKGTLRFPLDKPLPADLIRRIVAIRLEENARPS